MNSIIKVAKSRRKEKYITSEDITMALNEGRFTTQFVRRDLLEILGKQTEYDVEDVMLCAVIAWKGKDR